MNGREWPKGTEMTDFLVSNIEHGLTGKRDESRFSGALRIRNGRIAEIGQLSPKPGEKVIDARGCVVTPGLVNTHHHLWQSVLKGVPAGMNAALDDWLMRVPYTWWPVIDEAALRCSASIGLAELALTGCTTVSDHHYLYSHRYDYDPTTVLFDVAGKFGMRFVLARGGGTRGRKFTDEGLLPSPSETLEGFLAGVTEAAARFHDPAPDAMRRVVMAPTTPTFNLDEGHLREVVQAARAAGLRIHSHLSENRSYAAYTMAQYGKRPVEWLAGLDWLGTDVWFAHLVDLEPFEVQMLAETGSGMAHCPQANARLGSGIAPADMLHDLGGRVSLAVDGAGANEAADMGAAMYSAFALHRAQKGVQAVRAETVIHWATAGGAQVLGLDLGSIEIGKPADLAIFDLSAPRFMGLHDRALGPVVAGGAPVRHSFVAGRPLVVDGRLPGLDLVQLGEEAQASITRMTAALKRRAWAA
jgi:cytosine/adenosine deaminase-related metal-dependent hydrolase